MRQQTLVNSIKKIKHTHVCACTYAFFFLKKNTLLALGTVNMILQLKKDGNYRTSATKLVFCEKLMNHLLPMTGRKNTCLYPYVMNFYEVKFAVYKKNTL